MSEHALDLRLAYGSAPLTDALSAAGGTCAAHKIHVPRTLTTEMHHVIPQAWQAFWAPASAWWPAAGQPAHPGEAWMSNHMHDRVRPPVWDPRTIELCPTGHRNVHFYIVRLMHAATDESVEQAVKNYLHIDLRRRPPRAAEFGIAKLALQRWVAAGGSIGVLQANGQWGQA